MLDSDVYASAGKLRQIMADVGPFLSQRKAFFSETSAGWIKEAGGVIGQKRLLETLFKSRHLALAG